MFCRVEDILFRVRYGPFVPIVVNLTMKVSTKQMQELDTETCAREHEGEEVRGMMKMKENVRVDMNSVVKTAPSTCQQEIRGVNCRRSGCQDEADR